MCAEVLKDFFFEDVMFVRKDGHCCGYILYKELGRNSRNMWFQIKMLDELCVQSALSLQEVNLCVLHITSSAFMS